MADDAANQAGGVRFRTRHPGRRAEIIEGAVSAMKDVTFRARRLGRCAATVPGAGRAAHDVRFRTRHPGRCAGLVAGVLAAALPIAAAACAGGTAGEARTGRGASGAARSDAGPGFTAAGPAQPGGAPGSRRAAHRIRMALPAGAVDAADAAAFAELVESLSAGRVAVEIDADGGCGAPAACLAALRDGTVDVYRTTVPDVGRLFPELHVLDVPYLFETDEVVERVFRGVFFARMRDALLHRTGLRLMALGSAGGWRGIATAARVARAPDDLRGLVLRTADSPVATAWARALGATPAPGPPAALGAALASGRVDGTADGVVALVAAGLHDRFRHLIQDRHGYRAALWLMNEQAYQALPPDLRQLVRAGFDELARLSLARARGRAAEARAAFEAAGGRVHAPSAAERRAFVMAAGRVSTWYMEEYGYEWLVWLEGAIAEAEREIALAEAVRPPDG